jgi:hypothetical protein
MRSIPNVWQFSVGVGGTFVLLLLLFAIPADACSAQTAPPPVDESAFDGVPPTVVERLATRFSLGSFAGRFEGTRLADVREAVGEGTIQCLPSAPLRQIEGLHGGRISGSS